MADREIVGGTSVWVGQASPSANHNGDAFCLLQKSSGNKAYMFLYVAAPAPIVGGASVLECEIDVKVKASDRANVTLKATPLAAQAPVSKVTWNNMPGVKTDGLGALPSYASLTGIEPGDVFTFSVAPHMQAVADGDPWYGWRIEVDTDDTVVQLHSSRAAREARRPRMRISWSNKPAPPTDLAPSGARFVSVAKPTLRYTYLDFGGNRELVAHRIELDPTDPEGTTWDSGWLPTSDPELDLANLPAGAPAFAGLADDAAARWRAWVEDGAGLRSEASDWANFQRVTKGSLTLLSPAADPNNFVQEVTPAIVWDHAGPWAQTAFQVVVEQAGLFGNWYEIYDSGKLSGNDQQWTIPKGVLTRANWSPVPGLDDDWTVPTEYRATVRTWDGQQRERTPGDPVYYQARRVFTVKEGATAKVTDLAAVQDGPYPWEKITWSRTTAPDKFLIVRDGDIINEVLPSEVLVSGTSYEYVDKYAAPNRPHVWAVLPVVNGQMSPVESTWIKATVNSEHMWLMHPDRDETSAVLITNEAGPPELDAAMEDQGETYEIVGGSKRVRVTSALHGYAGSVSGHLLTDADDGLEGITAREWHQRMMAFKSEPGARLILTMSDVAIPVTIFNVTTRPTRWPDVRVVEFEFVQDTVPDFARAG